MRRRAAVWMVTLVALLPCAAAAANGKYTDPDSPEVAAAAHAALAHAKILDIVGVTLGIQAVLKDLNAKVTTQQIQIEINADVLFDFDKYTLRPEAAETLHKVGLVVASYPGAPLLIEGHTDGKGTHPYNMKLSEDRAGTVKQWLVANAGIEASRIRTAGLGETKPVAPNTNPDGSDNPQGRQKNRRVELTLQTQQTR
ncbi:MAG TPA: OmpA family protein [Bryobacteraceae bacterium]|nr:OmpA family protein [Bryobacteraceae bacterium]